MATLRDIRRRISGVKSTQKITRAMKMVAAAKLRRAQEAIVRARPYARSLADLLRHLSSRVDVAAYPHFAARPVRNVAIVVVTSDRGMCGAFNTNVMRMTNAHIDGVYRDLQASGHVKLICVGKKGTDFFTRRRADIPFRHPGVFHLLDFSTARQVAEEATAGFLAGEFDRVDVIYNEFKNAAQQRVIVEQFLPILPETAPKGHVAADYIYEPSGEAIVGTLLPKHLHFQMWRILLESNASAQGAQMTAMENATTNATEVINELQLTYNKARQASITKELLEIVGGAEALRKAG